MNQSKLIFSLFTSRFTPLIRCGVESSVGFVDSGFIVRDDWGGMCYAVGRSDWYPLVEGVLIASEFYVGR